MATMISDSEIAAIAAGVVTDSQNAIEAVLEGAEEDHPQRDEHEREEVADGQRAQQDPRAIAHDHRVTPPRGAACGRQ